MLVIKTGDHSFQFSGSGFRTYNVTFDTPFSKPPQVIPYLLTTSTSQAYGTVTPAVSNVSENGFVLRCYYYAPQGLNPEPRIAWIAIGES